MARPTNYDRQNSFALFSSHNPTSPHPGNQIDAEFNAVKVALDETQSNLNLIQDADGKLARASVGRGQLDSSITIGFESPLPWAQNTSYTQDISTVFFEARFYTCLVTHTSGSSFDPGKWLLVADLSAAAALPDGGVTEPKLADFAVTAAKVAPNAIPTSKLGAGAVTTPKIADLQVTTAKLADNAVTLSKLANEVLPAGLGPLPWSGLAAPTGWVLCAGQSLSRETYPALWSFAEAEIANGSTFYGPGDGSTTFTIVDMSGRTAFGKDDMSGTAKNRLTSAGSGIDGLTLGATGGAENVVLVQANLPNVDFVVSIPSGQGSHRHAYTDRGAQGNGQDLGNNPPVIGLPTTNQNTAFATLPAMSGTAASGGSGTAVNKMPGTVVTNFIIKAH